MLSADLQTKSTVMSRYQAMVDDVPAHRKASTCEDGEGHCTNLRIEVYSSTPHRLAGLRQCYAELHTDSVVRHMPLWTDLDLFVEKRTLQAVFLSFARACNS